MKGYGLRRQFDKQYADFVLIIKSWMEDGNCLYTLGKPSLRYSRPLQYVFSKDVTGWSEKQSQTLWIN